MPETEWDIKQRTEAQARIQNMPPAYDFYATQEASDHWPHHVELMRSGDWRPRSEYRPTDGEYVYVRGTGLTLANPGCAIARGGKYESSFWWNPDGQQVPLDVTEWKPFPDDGVTPYARWQDFKTMRNDPRWVRPPEPVYPPAGVDAKLTPVPRNLLIAMSGYTILHERAWRWTEWTLRMRGGAPEKLTESRSGILKLRQCAFIERDGVLPPGRLERWFEFDWKITAAGLAWIAANT
jgi:hypothetical protein